MRPVRLIRRGAGDVHFEQATAPLAAPLAWEVESLLIEVLEYGDYSLRSALRGDYSPTLTCSFALARRGGLLVGAAGCLYSPEAPATGIVGPVAVHASQRRVGIGTELVRRLVDHLAAQGCGAIYLGVAEGHQAVPLYEAAGFRRYQGIVMRLLLNDSFDAEHWCEGKATTVRPVCWGDFPGVQALLSAPCVMCTYDWPRGLLSSRYVPPHRFLPVFPEMMRALARDGGMANVLVTDDARAVVGIAQVRRLSGAARRHVAECDFYVHDHFIEGAAVLLHDTIRQCGSLAVRRLHCYCLSRDHVKREILEGLGARVAATLEGQACIDGEDTDVVIYQLEHLI